MHARIDSPALTVPGALKALRGLSDAVRAAGVPDTTLSLVELRAGQINGCSICVDIHSRELKHAGEPDERVYMVSAWRETPYFTEAERSALALTEAATRIADRPDPVPDEVWEEAARHYDERQLGALVLAIAGINAWNRINVATHQVTGEWVKQFVSDRQSAEQAA
jgi:AhpD family alkylhydroperoxidase